MLTVSQDNTSQIVKSLTSGQVVALPTETVFGLAICLNSASALEKLIYLKRRDLKSGKVFTLVPKDKADFATYAYLSKTARSLLAKYVPGELTMILPKNPEFSHPYFDHFSTVGLRLPKSTLFSKILPETGALLLTSANPRGDTPATDSETIKETLPKVDLLVEGKTPPGRLPSTIVDLTRKKPLILRQGSLHLPF